MKKRFKTIIIFGVLMFWVCPAVSAGDTRPGVRGSIYFDIATGHKYIKNQDSTYTEFSKKGKILRSDVPATLPLLASNKYILEVTEDHYLLYERKGESGVDQRLLPADISHPSGWRCKKIVSAVHATPPGESEAYSQSD